MAQTKRRALKRYHIPSATRNLCDYYAKFYIKMTAGAVSSGWNQLERSVITGCTISMILFTLTFNILIKSAEVEYRGPIMKTGVHQLPIRDYIDDLTVTTTSVTGS